MTTAFFESWRGRYSDNPRAISERLRVRYPDLHQAWAADDGTELPDGVRRVRRHTPEYFARLFTSRFLVTNDIVSRHYVKGVRTTYLQTWHGTPLKTIAFDETNPQYSGARSHMRRLTRDVRKWDALLSPSVECTRVFRKAFRFDGPVLELGYPRNDILRAPTASQVRRRVRDDLGISETARVALYAPTWRDGEVRGPDGFDDPGGLDQGEFMSLARDDTVLLMRMHNVVRTRYAPATHGGRILDVSDHPEIAELYLAADVLVSDYSSATFDFATTGKPIILFAYDLDHYRQVRRLYFDYEAWAPGPIVSTTEELVAAIDGVTIGNERTRYEARYAEFVNRFCPYDDGGASDRVIDALFVPVLEKKSLGSGD